MNTTPAEPNALDLLRRKQIPMTTPRKSTQDIPRDELAQVEFAFTTCWNRLDKLGADIVEISEKDEITSDDVMSLHDHLAEIRSKNIKLLHRIAKKSEV